MKKSGLRGRGGAGFSDRHEVELRPQGHRQAEIYSGNGDESEPGTCKDRPLMELDPHQLIEGMIIAGRAIGADRGYIYIRGEYRYVLDIVETAIAEAYAKGYLGKNILGSGFNFDLITPHRRGRLRMRRRIGADGIARRQARIPAHQASLPCCGRPVWLPDDYQQRGNA